MTEHGEPKGAAERRYASPPLPASGSDRVTELLFQWETRHVGGRRRGLAAWWRSSNRGVMGVAVVATLFLLGAGFAASPQPASHDADLMALESRLAEAENALQARQGELELARLELNRLAAIVEQSQQYRIPADLATAIHDIAISEGVDPALAFSLVRVESEFTGRAVSSAGAIGLTQVMPNTAFWLQPGLTRDDLFERDTNLRLGFRYLRMMLKQYSGDLHLALLAYNRGPGRVDEIIRAGGDPSNGYSRRVRNGARPPSD